MKRIACILVFALICINLTSQNIYRTTCQGNLTRLDSLLLTTSIDTKDNRGRSLLHWAVACKQDSVFQYLVEKEIAVNTEDNQGKTPMHMAVRFGNERYFDLLRELQPNDDWVASFGASLLALAVLKRDSVMIKKLLVNDVNVNSRNDRGSTALEISQRIKDPAISRFLLANGADKTLVRSAKMKGDYMGQAAPGRTPQMFAPNSISTEEYEFGSVFNSNATEFFYGVDVNGKNEIRYSKRTDDIWSPPKAILSHNRYGYNDPFLSPNDNRLYFISNRALDGIDEPKEDIDIWYVERTENGWSIPINAGSNINSSGEEYYISFTNSGTMYFSSNINALEEKGNADQDIYYSEFVDGALQKAVRLGTAINTENYEADVFIDPNENYLIFCAMRHDGLGRGDLYISFKNADGSWSDSKNIGDVVNTKNHELCPYVTPDGKYLFYTSNEDIYWVSTEILNDLKPQEGLDPSVSAMWNDFTKANPEFEKEEMPDSWFFHNNKEDANRLGALVLNGKKQAGSGLYAWYKDANADLPKVGTKNIITDFDGKALAIIETTKVDTVPFNQISTTYATLDMGTTIEPLQKWKKAHWNFFVTTLEGSGTEPKKEMLVVCERFKTVWPNK